MKGGKERVKIVMIFLVFFNEKTVNKKKRCFRLFLLFEKLTMQYIFMNLELNIIRLGGILNMLIFDTVMRECTCEVITLTFKAV